MADPLKKSSCTGAKIQMPNSSHNNHNHNPMRRKLDQLLMELLAERIDDVLNGDLQGADRTTGFILITFPFGPHGKEDCEKMHCIASVKHKQLADVLEWQAKMVRKMDANA